MNAAIVDTDVVSMLFKGDTRAFGALCWYLLTDEVHSELGVRIGIDSTVTVSIDLWLNIILGVQSFFRLCQNDSLKPQHS
jgi:hypothetical protein